MKNLDNPEGSECGINYQEIVNDMKDDLLTVLESYMDVMEPNEVFYHSIEYMTYALCEFNESDKEVLKVLKMAMESGMKKRENI